MNKYKMYVWILYKNNKIHERMLINEDKTYFKFLPIFIIFKKKQFTLLFIIKCNNNI